MVGYDDDRSEASIEAIARAFAAGHAVWLGTGGGVRTRDGARWEAAGFACRGVDNLDLAVLLWCCGVEDRAVSGSVWAALMADGSTIAVEDARGSSRRRWPKGMLNAMSQVVREELRPVNQRAQWTDWERNLRVAKILEWPPLTRKWWSERWGPCYRRLFQMALERECEARLCIGRSGTRVRRSAA